MELLPVSYYEPRPGIPRGDKLLLTISEIGLNRHIDYGHANPREPFRFSLTKHHDPIDFTITIPYYVEAFYDLEMAFVRGFKVDLEKLNRRRKTFIFGKKNIDKTLLYAMALGIGINEEDVFESLSDISFSRENGSKKRNRIDGNGSGNVPFEPFKASFIPESGSFPQFRFDSLPIIQDYFRTGIENYNSIIESLLEEPNVRGVVDSTILNFINKNPNKVDIDFNALRRLIAINLFMGGVTYRDLGLEDKLKAWEDSV